MPIVNSSDCSFVGARSKVEERALVMSSLIHVDGLAASEKLIQGVSSVILESVSSLLLELRLGDDYDTWANVCAARMKSANRRHRRQLRTQLTTERNRLLQQYNHHGTSTDLGEALLDAVGSVVGASATVQASWELLSHLYDGCMMYLTDMERTDMDMAITDILSRKAELDASVRRVTYHLHYWMPCFSIILPEAAFQTCLVDISHRQWSRRQFKRLVRPLLHDLMWLSTENAQSLEQDAIRYCNIVLDWAKAWSGDMAAIEFNPAAQSLLHQQSLIWLSLNHQRETMRELKNIRTAAFLHPLAVPNVDGVFVTLSNLQSSFASYQLILFECERLQQAHASLQNLLTANIDLLRALSPI